MATEGQDSTTQTEPGAGEPVEAAQTGTGEGGGQELQDQLAQAQAQLTQLKGFQSFHTQAKQAGVWDFAETLLKEADGNVGAAKEKVQAFQQAQQTLQELGDVAKVKERLSRYEELGGDSLYDNPDQFLADPKPVTPRPQPQQPVQPVVTDEQIEAKVRKMLESHQAQATLNQAKQAMAAQLATDAGLVKDGKPLGEAVTRFQALLDREVQSLTQGQRPANADDFGAAARKVNDEFITPLRASGVVPADANKPPETPPGMNGPGPGAQQPSRPLGEMSDAELNAHIDGEFREGLATLNAQPSGTTPTEQSLPDNWSFGG